MSFENYLRQALARARKDALNKKDNGDLRLFIKLCRKGVKNNWKALRPVAFLESYHRCIAASGKRVQTLEKYFEQQVRLFRLLNPSRVVRDKRSIRKEWAQKKCYLSPRMVDAVIETAKLIDNSWVHFRERYLLLPENADSESLDDWKTAHAALKRLPMVSDANAWYLIRNLYGAPVLKPDVHIKRISMRFFPRAKSPLAALRKSIHRCWKRISPKEPVHLGIVDYILWWYSQATSEPRIKVADSC